MLKDSDNQFSEKGFWQVVQKYGRTIPFLRNALAMYYCWADSLTPLPVKAAIIAALVYFVAPFDLTPDFIPVIGWLDDATVIATTLAAIHMYITAEHWEKADKVFGSMAA